MRERFRQLEIWTAALLLTIPAWSQSPDYAAAVELFHQRHWTEAAAAFTAVEQKFPAQTDALLYHGKCMLNLAHYDEAFGDLGAYLKLHPESDDAAYLLAYTRFRQDKPAESLQLYTAAAKLKTPSAEDLKVVALNYVLLNDYSDAAKYLEMALQMDPANIEARYHLGRVRYQQNQFDAAITAFEEVLKKDPDNIKAEDNLGLSLEARNRTEEAIAAYRRAIALDQSANPHNEQPYLNLGILLNKMNKAKEAVTLLDQAVKISPRSYKVHYELGRAYFNVQNWNDAEREASAAVDLDPAQPSAHYLLGRIYHRMGKADLEAKQFAITEELMKTQRAHSSGMASDPAEH
jgi:tetratricopeptide (TPR) repeat protein